MILGSILVFLMGILMFGSPILAICIVIWCILEYIRECP